MDCLTFRRKLLEDPLRQEKELLAHENDCDQCADFARRTRAQEVQLRALLNEINPPPELADRIHLAASFERPPFWHARRWIPVAAGVLLVVATLTIGWFVSPLERQAMSMADSVLDHMHDEIHHLHEVRSVTPARLANLFAQFGAAVVGDLGRLNFAAECLMRRKNGIHLVMPGRKGPVTVFFMPDETPAQYTRLSDASFDGYIVPTSWGSLAVVGIKKEPLEGVADRMLRAVNWSAPVHAGMMEKTTPPQA